MAMPNGDPALEALEALLSETAALECKDSKISQNIAKAQELVRNVKITSKGILSRFSLDGQVALVTGGGQGPLHTLYIGECGCKVAIADLELNRAEAVKSELQAKGIPSLALKVDVSNKKQVEEMVQKVLDKFGDLHIGVNNAGIVFHSNSEETSETEWNKTLGVNLNGVFFCCQAEAQHMLKKGYGRIINTASMSGTIVNRPQKQVAYNTSKAAVVHMTKTLGAEWAEQGVTVNCISPGYVDTLLNRSEHLMPLRALWIKDTPMQRLADVEDLTGACVYLASPTSNFTTGLDMIIDGGFTCW